MRFLREVVAAGLSFALMLVGLSIPPDNTNAAELAVDPWVTACQAGEPASRTLASLSATFERQTVQMRLQCGTSTTYGFRHIRFRHENQWQDLWSKWRGNTSGSESSRSGGWSTFMWRAAVSAWRSSRTLVSGAKICSIAELPLARGSTAGNKLRVVAIWSANNSMLITAYPSDNERACVNR